jgi:hypothetical protein
VIMTHSAQADAWDWKCDLGECIAKRESGFPSMSGPAERKCWYPMGKIAASGYGHVAPPADLPEASWERAQGQTTD